MWIVTSALLMLVGVGMLLVAFMAYRTADAVPDLDRRGTLVWAATAVVCAACGLWTTWAAAFILAGNL